jgi:radical SAM superfamily enzyme YgiQ (UPF0313 family)
MPHPDSIGLHKFMICEPLELEYLVAAVADLGHEVRIVDMILEKKPLTHFLREFNPDVVGMTAYISHVGVVRSYASEVKRWKRSCLTLIGGVHSEVNPGDFVPSDVDYVLNLNGVHVFRNLVMALQEGRSPEEALKTHDECETRLRVNDRPLFPDRQSTARYRDRYSYIFHDRCATLKTSYGCAYNCEFCFCVEITKHRYSERDLNEVIAEIKTIREDNLFIVDDNFLFREERVREFMRLMKEHGINKRFITFGRADFVANHPELMKDLYASGLRAVFVGIESFKDGELENMNKRTSVEMNLKAVRTLEAAGIECYSGIIVGMDWEDRDFTTLARWLNSFEWPIVNIQPITPMPGTPVFERFKERITVPRERYELWDMAHLLMEPEKMSRRRYYLNIIRTYLTSSVGVGPHIKLVRKYGLRVYLRVLYGVTYVLGQYVKLALKG